MRKALKATMVVLLAGILWSAAQYASIAAIGETARPAPADVIIVLGAAVWPQGPSPALQARIRAASTVYREGLAGDLILSGGLGEYPPTEAEAMQGALLALGIAPAALHLEAASRSTVENLTLSRRIMAEQGWTSAIIVTDAFHMKRALLIARDLGIDATGAPVTDTVLYTNRNLRMYYTCREVAAITLYYGGRVLEWIGFSGGRAG